MLRPYKLALLFGLPPAITLGLAALGILGGGHPSLGAVLLSWFIHPTLTGYLSRAFLGTDFPPYLVMLLGVIEYSLVGFGLGSLLARIRAAADRSSRLGVLALVGYLGLQLAAHVALNRQSVNSKLVFHENPLVSEAAVKRIQNSGNTDAIPILQQKLLEDLAAKGYSETSVLDTLTKLGGARGWHELLESRRLGVVGREAREWNAIIHNVRAMSNPLYAEARGGVTSPYLRGEDIESLVDALARKLAEHLEQTPDAEASLTLLWLMKERPDLCATYLAVVPHGLRGPLLQASYDVIGSLAGMKSGQPPGVYNYQVLLSREEIFRVGREQQLIAEEWAAWAKSEPSPCRSR